MMLRRNYELPVECSPTTRPSQILLVVNTDTGEVHMAWRPTEYVSWGPPLREVFNQDSP